MIENWRPISLLSGDLRILSKAIASCFKVCLNKIISSGQCTYVEGRFIRRDGRLFYDISEACKLFGVEGYLVTVDIQKAFDSINHCFLQSIKKRYGFGRNFVHVIKTLLKNQESCVIKSGKSTKYFPFQRGTRLGNSVQLILLSLY